ncbi:hypothetical protein PG985_011557 [Apiospora marii]|uniref:Uncharacterized protein n=1 Tax=Apiospora marii TaxID=335849 RepID=A0ABR1R0V7_9PEZI
MSQAKPSWASLLLQSTPRSRASAGSGAAYSSEPPDDGASNRNSAADPPQDKVNNNSSAAASVAVQSPATTTMPPPRRVAMISGHIDLSPEEFARGYHAQLDAALEKGDAFIMGDAKGADELALAYLLAKDPSTAAAVAGRITVYASRQANVARLEQTGVKVALAEMHNALPAEGDGRGHGRGQQQRGPRKGGRGREHHLRRDAMMTGNSDYDILWVRTEAESRALYGDKYRPRVSATELNRQRRAEILARQGGSN